jgi:mannosyltransferase OCH1-like enzyme
VGDAVIERSLHFVWVGSKIPRWAIENIMEWERLHPDWELEIWRDENMPELMNQRIYDRADRLFPRDAVGQFRADLARYEILYQFGGFYADVDTKPLRPIDDALEGHSEFAVMETRDVVGNTYLGAEAGSALMLALVRELPGHMAQNTTWTRATVASGPQYMTPLWKKMGGFVDTRTELWFPYGYKDVKSAREDQIEVHPDAYSIHAFNHVRELKGRGLA